MKSIKWILSFVVIFSGVFLLASCMQSVSAQDDSYLTIDINPSVELIVNGREKVVYANPLNEDAEILLAELELEGMDLEDAMDLIIQTAIELGYIDPEADETYVSVSSISENAEMAEKIRERAKEHINNAFSKRYMMGKAQDKGFTPEFVLEAESLGVTPGFLFLAKTAVEVNDELLLEDALLMTVQELQAVLKEAKAEMRDVVQGLKEYFLAARKDLFDQYLPQLETIHQSVTDKEAELVVLEESLAQKEAELLEALEENKQAIQAEIDAINLEIEALQLEIDTLKADVEALHTEFMAAVKALRDEFHEQSKALRDELKNLVQSRRSMFENRVRQFFENHQNDDEDEKNNIKNWQKGRP